MRVMCSTFLAAGFLSAALARIYSARRVSTGSTEAARFYLLLQCCSSACPARHVGVLSLAALFRERGEYAGDGVGEALPLGGFVVEVLSAFGGEAVEAGFAIVFGDAVFALDEPGFEEALEGGVERAVAYLEDVVGALLNGVGDGVAVGAAQDEGLQDEQVERALEEIELRLWVSSRHST